MKKEDLEQLEELGGLQFSIAECAIIMHRTPDALNAEMTEDKEIMYAYERGRLKESAMVRDAILTQAKNGSSPAQRQMMDLIQSVEEKNKISVDKIEGFDEFEAL